MQTVSLWLSANVFGSEKHLEASLKDFSTQNGARRVSCEVWEDALEHQRQPCLFCFTCLMSEFTHFVLHLTPTWQCGTTGKHILTGGKNKLVGGTNVISIEPHFTKWRKMKATLCPMWWVMNHRTMIKEYTVFLWNKSADWAILGYVEQTAYWWALF